MTIGRILALIGIGLLVIVVNVAVSVLYMVVYGHIIDPGHEQLYYDEHVKVAAPYCSIIAGTPLMFLAGWWAGGWDAKLATQSALIIWLVYAAIDVAVLAAYGFTAKACILVGTSLLTKLAAVYFGAVVASRNA